MASLRDNQDYYSERWRERCLDRVAGYVINTEWHPWFAWYPVWPFFFGDKKYPEMEGTKMTDSGWPIWLRRCWRRRIVGCYGADHEGPIYEYRRWITLKRRWQLWRRSK